MSLKDDFHGEDLASFGLAVVGSVRTKLKRAEVAQRAVKRGMEGPESNGRKEQLHYRQDDLTPLCPGGHAAYPLHDFMQRGPYHYSHPEL